MRTRVLLGSIGFALVLLPRASTFCASSGPGASELKDLPACTRLGGASQSGWRVVTRPTDGIVVSAPASFVSFDRGVLYNHGGAAWRTGEAVLEIAYGWWGRNSFPNHEKACRTMIDGLPTMYIEEQTETGVQVVAWFITSNHYDPVLSAWSTRADDLVTLRSILGSVKNSAVQRDGKKAP
jgi:hypothetical protein